VDVLLNARAWNDEVRTPIGRQRWGRRRVQYFVAVPYSGEFAPSKFCAFLPIRPPETAHEITAASRMTLEYYVQLDQSEPRFDGNIAQRHLTKHLGMLRKTLADDPRTGEQFSHWLKTLADLISVPSTGPVLLLPPEP
jgi:hypothetical protein